MFLNSLSIYPYVFNLSQISLRPFFDFSYEAHSVYIIHYAAALSIPFHLIFLWCIIFTKKSGNLDVEQPRIAQPVDTATENIVK